MQGFGTLRRLDGPGVISDDNPWFPVRDGDGRVRAMLNRHYSGEKRRGGAPPRKSLGPGQYVLLMTTDSRAVFGWIRNTIERLDGEEGIYCPIFRNEGPQLSSGLILAAEEFALRRWPQVSRMFTYIDPDKVESPNPGYCFKMAGWEPGGWSKSGKLLLAKRQPEVLPGTEGGGRCTY